MIIRTATVDDADAAAQTHLLSWQQTYRGIVPDSYLRSIADGVASRVERRRANFAIGDPLQLVACEEDGSMVGFLSAGTARDARTSELGFSAEIYSLYLLKVAQRKGLGTAMMREAFVRLMAAGHLRASICVLRENHPAVAFYARMGAKLLFEDTLDLGGQACPELVMGIECERESTIAEGGVNF